MADQATPARATETIDLRDDDPIAAAATVNSSQAVVHHRASVAPTEGQRVDDYLQDRIITLIVGDEEAKYVVHEKLLSSMSPYFRRILNEDSEAAHCNEIQLRDTNPKLFSMLLRFIYGTAFSVGGSGRRDFRFPVPDGVENTVSDFLGLYVLGGQLEMSGLKNAAIDAVYSYFIEDLGPDVQPRCPSLPDVQMIFDNTPVEAHMRSLLIAHVVFYIFSPKRRDSALPEEWEEVLLSDGTIGWAMIQMMSAWGWKMGVNVPPMRIKARISFHEPLVIDLEPVKKEEDDGLA